MAIVCASCNFDNPPGMKFCGNCGARLALPEASPTAPVAAPTKQFSPAQMGSMMGANLMERFRQAGLEVAGQRRNVTILFADLSGSTALAEKLDSEDVFNLIQQLTHSLAQNVYKYDGMVDKFTGDGLMALFGAPLMHENNAELALRSALDMQADLARLSEEMQAQLQGVTIRMHLGLHSGSVIVGGVGSDLMMNYTAIGDTVNLARRLEEAAPAGSIFVSEAVQRQTKALFEFETLPPLTLKGVSQAVTAFRAVGEKVQPGSVRGLEGLRAPLIGRETELTRLTQALTQLVETGQGQVVLLTGNAGFGKSRLTSEFKALTQRTRARILEGFSLTYRRSVSYWIFLEALRGYLGITPGQSEAQIHERLHTQVKAVLGAEAHHSLPYLENLLSLPPSETAYAERLRYLDAGQLRRQTFLAVRDLLVAEARRQPLILILDDLHWADEASLDLLLFLVDSVPRAPLLLYTISRPLQGGTLSKFAEHAEKLLGEYYTALPLQNLSLDQSEQLLVGLLTIPDFPEKLREQILQRAAGIPFYLEEILRMLIDGGVIHRVSDRWQLAPGADVETVGVPESLQGLILTRFDRLEETPRQVLQVAAVIGRYFSWPLLKAVLRTTDEAPTRAALTLLVEREFVEPQGTANTEFAFRHVLVSDAIYDTLLKRSRSDLHGQVGEAIETLFTGHLEEQVELLARHFALSPQRDRALHYLILAGQKAAQNYVNGQARQHYEQAFALLPQTTHTAQQALAVRSGLGDMLTFMGEYEPAREHYMAAQSSLDTVDPQKHWAKERSTLERKVGITYERQGDYDDALMCLAVAQNALLDLTDPVPLEHARILHDMGWVHFRRGEMEAAENCLRQGLALAEPLHQADLIASLYNRLGGIYYQKDDIDQASIYLRKSLMLREEIGDIVAVARSYNNLGLLGWKRGDWNTALESFQRSFELNTTLGDVEATMELHGNLGLLQLDRGELAEAREHLTASLAMAQQVGHSYLTGMACLYLNRLALAEDNWAQALEYGQRSLAILTEIEARDDLPNAHTFTGMAWLGLGQWDDAQRAGEQALQLIAADNHKANAPVQERGYALRLLGFIAHRRDQFDLAHQQLTESAAIFVTIGDRLEQGRAKLALAKLAHARGQADEAQTLEAEAQGIFEALGARERSLINSQ